MPTLKLSEALASYVDDQTGSVAFRDAYRLIWRNLKAREADDRQTRILCAAAIAADLAPMHTNSLAQLRGVDVEQIADSSVRLADAIIARVDRVPDPKEVA